MKQLFVCVGSLCSSLFVAVGCAAQMVDSSSAASITPAPVLPAFVREQLQFSRVRHARDVATSTIEDLFHRRGISYPASEMFIRVFKRERELELWVRSANSPRFELLRTYPVCALAGVLGPKAVEGDGQVPEGFYTIDLFNPASSYHLSLRIDYPNERDRAAAPKERALGGQIFIHGGCKSDGCLAITNEGINELYWLAVMVRGRGQERIPVALIFPTRLDDASRRKIERAFHRERSLLEFWETLRPGYDYFEKTHQLPLVGVDDRGRYRISR